MSKIPAAPSPDHNEAIIAIVVPTRTSNPVQYSNNNLFLCARRDSSVGIVTRRRAG